MTQHPFPAFSLSGASIKYVTQKLYCEVEDGNHSGHQCWDAACGIQRGIGIHDTTMERRGSIAIECVMKAVGIIKCPLLYIDAVLLKTVVA